jgi:hypothetical protein
MTFDRANLRVSRTEAIRTGGKRSTVPCSAPQSDRHASPAITAPSDRFCLRPGGWGEAGRLFRRCVDNAPGSWLADSVQTPFFGLQLRAHGSPPRLARPLRAPRWPKPPPIHTSCRLGRAIATGAEPAKAPGRRRRSQPAELQMPAASCSPACRQIAPGTARRTPSAACQDPMPSPRPAPRTGDRNPDELPRGPGASPSGRSGDCNA